MPRRSRGQDKLARWSAFASATDDRPLVTLSAVGRAIHAANAAVLQAICKPYVAQPGEVEEPISAPTGPLLASPGSGDHAGRDRRVAGAAVGEIAGGHAPQRKIRAALALDPAVADVGEDLREPVSGSESLDSREVDRKSTRL